MACDWQGMVGRDVLGGHSHTLLCVDMHKHLTSVILDEGLNQEFVYQTKGETRVSAIQICFCFVSLHAVN